ncbi:MAG TPA: hypothetical protein VIF15_06365 [Polyangiaceae bacterium]|jgi:hypothetical protein
MTRREALALLGALASAACGGHRAASPAPPPAPALRLDPVVDLVPAAGLVWLVESRLRELLASPAVAPAVAMVLPEARFDAFAGRHGGVDLRRVSQLAVAGYPEATLALARVELEPARVEAAFGARALVVEGRAVEGGITRLWGTVGHERQQLALLGHEALGLERGRFGPLRAALYFAQGKLRRALPALRAEPLATAAALAGDAPLRAFAPGPFEGAWAAGLGGLLRAATAVAATLRPVERAPGGAVALRVVLTGAWGADAGAAAERLAAAFNVLAADPLTRLMGLEHPLDGPRAYGDAGALRLEVTLDALALGRGLHDATDATIGEIMAYSVEGAPPSLTPEVR